MSSDEALAVLTFIGTVSVVIRPATIHFSTIRYNTRYDMLHNNKTRRVLARVLLVASEVCTADKPSLEYNAKHRLAWIFLISLFGKSPCIRTKKRKEGEH